MDQAGRGTYPCPLPTILNSQLHCHGIAVGALQPWSGCVSVWGRLAVGGSDVSCFALGVEGRTSSHFLPSLGQPLVWAQYFMLRCAGLLPIALWCQPRVKAHLEGRLSPEGLICLPVGG